MSSDRCASMCFVSPNSTEDSRCFHREEDQLGDTSTLADASVVQTLLKMRGQ